MLLSIALASAEALNVVRGLYPVAGKVLLSNVHARSCAVRDYGCENGYCWQKCKADGSWCWMALSKGTGDCKYRRHNPSVPLYHFDVSRCSSLWMIMGGLSTNLSLLLGLTCLSDKVCGPDPGVARDAACAICDSSVCGCSC